MNIEILEIRSMNDGRPLKAFVDIQVEEWIIRDWRVWQQNGRAYVSPPQASWRDPNTGQIKFKPILTIPDDQLQRIQTEILHFYHRGMEKEHVRENN